MGTNNLSLKTSGPVVGDDFNQFHTAFGNDFVGRNSAGVPTSGKQLGTQALPWGDTHIGRLFLNGSLFDADNIGLPRNAIVSGQSRSTSDQPDFIRAAGTGASFTIEGATTTLELQINGAGVTVTTDIVVGSLPTAPGSNNTALVDDSDLSGGEETKYQGERTSVISIDNVGTEISDRVGEWVALKHGTSEIMFAYVKDANTLSNVFRGFFFDDSGDPIVREVISNNDTLTLYEMVWVFVENDGVTADTTTTSPVWSFTEPSSPATGDYWFDFNADLWKRYDGSDFIEINRHLIGVAVLDQTNCIATRSFDFSKSFSDVITFEVEIESVTKVTSDERPSLLSVYGNMVDAAYDFLEWDITADLESGLTEASDTVYWLYVTEKGETVISRERPYLRHDLKGQYHPYNTWRFVGNIKNDGSSDITVANSVNTAKNAIQIFDQGQDGDWVNPDVPFLITVAGGSGGVLAGGADAGSSSFGSFITADGGSSFDITDTSALGQHGRSVGAQINFAGANSGALDNGKDLVAGDGGLGMSFYTFLTAVDVALTIGASRQMEASSTTFTPDTFIKFQYQPWNF